MRRMVVLVLLVVATLGGAARADAHICSTGVQIPVGQAAPVPIVMTVEATPVPDVEIDLPRQLQVVGKVVPPDGWTVTKRGQTLRYRGGPFNPLTCPSFSITAQATEKGAYTVDYVLRDAGGHVVARTGATSGAQSIAPVVYAGVKPTSSSSSSGPSLVVVAGIVLIALALLLFGGMAFRSWRLARADERDEELEDRLAAFKKQAQDRKEERSPQ